MRFIATKLGLAMLGLVITVGLCTNEALKQERQNWIQHCTTLCRQAQAEKVAAACVAVKTAAECAFECAVADRKRE